MTNASLYGFRSVACLLALAALAGCGSGGGGSSAESPPLVDNGNGPEEPLPQPVNPPSGPENPWEPGNGDGAITINWIPPTENTDGSALNNLEGYNIHFGTQSGQYDTVIHIDNPGITSYVVEGLDSGTYYFALTAVAASGIESGHSGEASARI